MKVNNGFKILIIYLMLCMFCVYGLPGQTSSLPELSNDELIYIKNNPVLRVHVEEKWPPFNYIEYNEIKGYSNDYVRLLAEKLGFKIEFITGYTWNEYIEMLKANEIDIISNMKITPDRTKYAQFSERSIVEVFDGIAFRIGNDQNQDIEQLDGKVLAVVKGYFHEELLKRYYPEINILLTNNTLESIQALAAGKADAAIESAAVMNYYIAKYFYSDLLVRTIFSDDIFKEAPQHIGIRKDRPILKRIIDKGIASISQTEITELRKRWFGVAQDAQLSEKQRIILSTEEIEYLKNKKMLTYCVDPSRMPFEGLVKGNHIGITADFVRDFEKMIGIPLKCIATSGWNETLDKVMDKKCDFVPLVMETALRKEFINFTRSYINVPLVIVTKNKSQYINSFSNLKKYKFGVTKNYPLIELVQSNYPGLNIVEVDSIKDGLEMIKKGDLFGYIDALHVLAYEIQHRYPDLKINRDLNAECNFSIAVRNDEAVLLNIFSKVIDNINISRQQQIMNNWLSVRYEKGIDSRLLWKLVYIFCGVMVVVLLFAFYRQYLFKKYRAEIDKISNRDELTDICNRRCMDYFLDKQIHYSERIACPLSLILFDVDNFAPINDQFGRKAGDSVLAAISLIINSNIRKIDIFGRWDDDAFLLICPNTSKTGVSILAEKLRVLIEKNIFSTVGYVTCSFGVAEFAKGMISETLIALADRALFSAKLGGKNCVNGNSE